MKLTTDRHEASRGLFCDSRATSEDRDTALTERRSRRRTDGNFDQFVLLICPRERERGGRALRDSANLRQDHSEGGFFHVRGNILDTVVGGRCCKHKFHDDIVFHGGTYRLLV